MPFTTAWFTSLLIVIAASEQLDCDTDLLRQNRRMIANKLLPACLFVGLVVGLTGCRSQCEFDFCGPTGHYQAVATQIEYPDTCEELSSDLLNTPPPHTVRRPGDYEPWDLTLEEAIHMTLANSPVMRDLGGRVVSSPASTTSVYDPAITETNLVSGPEAALADFDGQFNASMIFNRSERSFNNAIFGGGATKLAQNTGDFQAEFSKTAAIGTRFAFRNVTNYNRNNVALNAFPSAYDTVFEMEARQPLWQGAGIAFNRIAGPNAQPGVYRGVLIGRINTDIALADFEAAVTTLVNDVENTYWQLYFSYRDLDAKTARRDAALQTWRAVRNRFETGFADGEREALARQQYYESLTEVENALSGTRQSGLTVSTAGGVYTVERQLRYLMGLKSSDGRLIRPADTPIAVDIVFDWQDSIAHALARRVELRKQRWNIRRRELELVASRNFTRARLDMVGQYRWRGFGDDLLGQRDVANGSAFGDLFGGDLQGWQLGLVLSTPIGNRIGHTAVRNAQLNLSRERAIIHEQELRVVDELSSAFAELDRAYSVTRSNYNRSIAAHRQLQAIRAKYETGTVLLEQVLDAQQRATEADSAYYRSLVNHNLSINRVHLSRGTLLDFYDVHLAEGPWTDDHHISALDQARRFRPSVLNYGFTCPQDISLGEYPQELYPGESEPAGEFIELPEVEPNMPQPDADDTPPLEPKKISRLPSEPERVERSPVVVEYQTPLPAVPQAIRQVSGELDAGELQPIEVVRRRSDIMAK